MMQTFINNLLDVRSTDEEIRQRGRNIIIIALGLIVINVLVFFNVLLSFSFLFELLIPVLLAVVLYGSTILIARQGRVDLAGWIVVIASLIGTIGASVINPQRPVTMFLAIPVLLAVTILRLYHLVIVFGIVSLGLLTFWLRGAPTPTGLTARDLIQTAIVLNSFVAVIGFVQSAGNEALHRRLRAALESARQTAGQLQALNTDLDARVRMQTEALQEAMQELEARAMQQDRLLAEVIAQRDVIRQLSVPVLPVGKDALVMPLVGVIDHDRLRMIVQQALEQIERQRARWLILDVTGVPVIDTEIAAGLVQLVQSVRLLGAEVALVGVRPEVAQTMVSLGVELPISRVYSDLAAAIDYVRSRQAGSDAGVARFS